MNTQGIIVMAVSVGSVLALVSYCMYRVLNLPSTGIGSLHGELKIDTGDQYDAD